MTYTLQERLEILAQWGDTLLTQTDILETAIQQASLANGWFTPDNCHLALNALCANYLHPNRLREWASRYMLPANALAQPKTVGLVMAGNIPLVGLHDFLCVWLTGNKAQIKLSSKDEVLPKAIFASLFQLAPQAIHAVDFVPRLHNFDAVIATGSNNSARYFDYYFGKYPNIIRQNRNAVGVLTGNETEDDLEELGKDVFQYFGLGCRSVSAIYVPPTYDFPALLDRWAIHYSTVADCNKYKNNLDYQCAIALLNREPHFAAPFLMLRENASIASPIGVLHYQHYTDESSLAKHIAEHSHEIQCVVGNIPLCTVPFGGAQQPQLWDYADNIDTVNFLLSLNDANKGTRALIS